MEDRQEARARILVVDDEEGMREGCRRALAPLGYRVDTAATLAEGQRLVRSEECDLFLLDVMLPDGSGLALIEPILERDADAICIIITGFATIELAVEAIRRGAFDFLSKPFTSDELIVAVNQGLERRRLKAIEAEAQELAQLKEELEKLDEMKSRFMLSVSHELRAPTAAVQSYVNLILGGYVTEEEMRPTLTRIQSRLEEMLALIADLLELARLKQLKEGLPEETKPQGMAEVLEEVSDLLGEQARQKGQSFRMEILDRPTIAADRDHLRQIWTNLISNAIKYTPEGGRIAISLRTDDGMLIGSVEDSGMGIAQDDVPRLFQEFFRTDQARASGEIGTGLGLSIVKQIVESYHGEIRVTSELGQGTCFTFALPLNPPRAAGEEEVPAALQPERARRLVLPWSQERGFVLGDDGAPTKENGPEDDRGQKKARHP